MTIRATQVEQILKEKQDADEKRIRHPTEKTGQPTLKKETKLKSSKKERLAKKRWDRYNQYQMLPTNNNQNNIHSRRIIVYQKFIRTLNYQMFGSPQLRKDYTVSKPL